MHSPWGVIYQLMKELGMTKDEVLWSDSKLNLTMMVVDRPGFKHSKDTVEKVSGSEIERMMTGIQDGL